MFFLVNIVSSKREIDLFSAFYIDIDHNRILMAKPWACNHVVLFVPVNITYCVHEFAFIVVWMELAGQNIPHKWGSCLWPARKIGSIWRHARPHIYWLVFCPKEPLSNSGFFSSLHFILNDSDAIVFWVDYKFVLLLGINYNASDGVVFKFLMPDYKLICCVDLSLENTDVPASDKPYRVSNEHSACVIKSHTVWIDEVCQKWIPHKVHVFQFSFNFTFYLI